MSAKALFGLLLTYMGDDDFCYPSLSRIEKDLACSRKTAVKAIKELELEDLITIKKQDQEVNKYFLSSGENKKSLTLKLVEGGKEITLPSVNNIPPQCKKETRGSVKNTPDLVEKIHPKDKEESNNNIKEGGSVKNTLGENPFKVFVDGEEIKDLPKYFETYHTNWFLVIQKQYGKDLVYACAEEYIRFHEDIPKSTGKELRQHFEMYLPKFQYRQSQKNRSAQKNTSFPVTQTTYKGNFLKPRKR